jgi:uncharacterized RDD family membrane protein YckC
MLRNPRKDRRGASPTISMANIVKPQVEPELPVMCGEKQQTAPELDLPKALAGQPDTSTFKTAARFLRENWFRVGAVSVAVLMPCWWHSRIEAGDLGSHTYNAWLAQMIERGQAPGLWLARQWNNVLFDIALTDLGKVVGLRLAEKIVISAAVLLFFWSAFTLIAALTRRSPWFLVPCVAMFAYGWTFQMGFLNYYISLGMAFLGVAIVTHGRGWERLAALALLPGAWMAHPLGAVLLAGGSTYIYVAGRFFRRRQTGLLIGTSVLLTALCLYITGHYEVVRGVSTHNYLQVLGADQLVLYGTGYRLIANLLLMFMLACVVTDVISRVKMRSDLAVYNLPLQLCAIVVVLTFLLPDGILLPQYAASLSLLPERVTSITAILACGLVGLAKPQKWHWGGFLIIAATFFFFLYADTGKLNKMEEQAERYERVLPGRPAHHRHNLAVHGLASFDPSHRGPGLYWILLQLWQL